MSRKVWLQAGVVSLALVPALWLAWGLATDALGADPVAKLTHETGAWALRMLLASLAITPLRRTFGWSVLAPLRRTLGLFAFGYAALHLLVYAVLDQALSFEFVWEDVSERAYITVGFGAFLCLLALAVTSTRGWIRSLGKRWVQLHRLAYVAAIGGVVHFLWLVKKDLREPLIYAAVLAVLLGVRVVLSMRSSGTKRAPIRD